MWTAKIMPLRFIGVSGYGTTADAVSAILYANSNGAHVISNSWGGGGYSQALKDAIDASDAVVVCASGNNGKNNDTIPFYPASYSSSNIIAVAATDHNDNLAHFSNYGSTSVDVGAPGVSIYSTVPHIAYGSLVTVYNEDFDIDSGNLPLLGWDRGGTYSTWAVTEGTGVNGTNGLEDSPNKNYRRNTDSWAGYMTQIPSKKDNLYTLSFKWKGVVEASYDYFDILFSSDGITWELLESRTGSTGGGFIDDSTNEITLAADLLSNFYIGFGLYSDYNFNYDGVYLDDVSLTRRQVIITGYTYTGGYSGTSMATPHVSGVAGLIKALNPLLTNLEIKNAILNNVDAKSSLAGKVVTGGRLNAYNAVNSVPIDSDGDGILDNGDGSGVAGDNPCTYGNAENCDDNCIDTPNPDQADVDSDGVGDLCDNCSQTSNAGQQDTDSDGYGNMCDCDLDNDGFVGPNDYSLFGEAWWSNPSSPNWNADADFDSDEFVGPNDYSIFGISWWTSEPWY